MINQLIYKGVEAGCQYYIHCHLWPCLAGDLSPLYEPLLAALSADDGQELIEHPCAHWVVKKLIVIDSKRGGEVKQEETSGEMFREGDLSTEDIVPTSTLNGWVW